jgi:hypothetical protein
MLLVSLGWGEDRELQFKRKTRMYAVVYVLPGNLT